VAQGPIRLQEPEAGHPAGNAASVLATVWSVLGSVVAPATMVGALLFYFGYVSARTQFAYFGVDVDTLGFSTREFVMRAPQPLLVPALVLLLGSAAGLWGGAVVRHRLRSAPAGTRRRTVRGVTVIGAVILALDLALLFAYPEVGARAWYPLVTPLLLAAGAGLLALAARAGAEQSPATRSTVVLLVLVVIAALFWATATLAQWSGTGRAKALARDMDVLPAVVLDTGERLFPGDRTVVESTLPGDGDQTYRFRYRGLRLLVHGNGRLFLVPEQWSVSGSTYVIPIDTARVRFRFVNDPP
jgi:hypothetical protein